MKFLLPSGLTAKGLRPSRGGFLYWQPSQRQFYATRNYSKVLKYNWEKISFKLEGDTFEPKGRYLIRPPVECNVCIDGCIALDSSNVVQIVGHIEGSNKRAACLECYPRLTRSLKTSWKYSPKKHVIYHRGHVVDGEFNFLPEGGLDENQSSTKCVNNKSLVINVEPISIVHPLNIAKNIVNSHNISSNEGGLSLIGPDAPSYQEEGKRLTVAGKRKKPYMREISIEQLYDIHDKTYMRQVVLDNVLNGRTRELISSLHKARASCDTMREKEIKKDKAYAELEKKCNESIQDLDKNPLVFDMRAEIETLEIEGLESKRNRLKAYKIQLLHKVDSLRQYRAAVVSRVISDATMKLIHSDEMGVLIARLVKESIIYGRCTAFEEVAELKKPFVLEEMPGYHPSSKEDYDRAGNDLADASYPFLAELTANPHASVEQLLSKKPQSLQSKCLSLRAS
nr:hypothetical protein [Tanacetum cinerariifolium]